MDMPEYTEIFRSILGGLQTLNSLTKDAKQHGASEQFTRELNTAVINMQGAVMDAQSMALEAQGEQAQLLTRVKELEEETRRNEHWEKDKARYELTDRDGHKVYRLRKDSRRDDEPTHFLCPTCYESDVKSILQVCLITDRPDSRCLRCDKSFSDRPKLDLGPIH